MKQLKVIGVLLVCLLVALTTGLRAQPFQEHLSVTPGSTLSDKVSPHKKTDVPPLAAGVCPGKGNCFQPNGTPGCDESTCCEAVCAVNPFCCEIEWDAQCAADAAEICGNCGDLLSS